MSEEPRNLVVSSENTRLYRVRGWMRSALGLDRAILFTVLARGWSSVAGLVTVALIAKFLSPAEQGYYYTFGSLVALQIVFELGFSFVILQMASHERAHLSISSDYVITGDAVAHARLASILQKSVRWYSIAAVLMAAALVPAGLYFFSAHQHPETLVFWRLPWCLAALAATINFQLDPFLSFLEGCGYVPRVALLRLAQGAVGSLLGWTAMLTHHGLFAPAMVMMGTALTTLFWLYGRHVLLLSLLRFDPGANRIHWMREVWSFQWRIAISWLCGYFIYYLFNPVLFAFQGPIAAGQMGMSLSLINALQAVAISWMSTKAAPYGTMVARKEYSRLDSVFFRTLAQSVAVYVAGALLAWSACLYLNMMHIRFAQRLLAPLPLAFLLLATLINIVVFGEALYLRAHKQEKFLVNSVLGAVLVATSTYFLGRYFGATGMVVGNLAIAVFMGLPLGTYTFIKYRRQWHAA